MFCEKCRGYTLKAEHCGTKTLSTRPPKYSPEDKYAEYRRKAKEEKEQENGCAGAPLFDS